MGKDDEVLPDSQDEAEFGTFEQLDSVTSPPLQRFPQPNVLKLPTPSSSSSFELPRITLTPVKRTAPSTISQYTTDKALDTLSPATSHRTVDTLLNVPNATSAISTCDSSASSSKLPVKPRPRPKPIFADTIEDISNNTSNHQDGISYVTSPSAAAPGRKPHAIPPLQNTFTADISERIKSRRAALSFSKAQEKEDKAKGHGDVKKNPTRSFEDVINISSDSDTPSGPSRGRPPPKRKGQSKQKAKSCISNELGLGDSMNKTPALRDAAGDGLGASSASPMKRKHDSGKKNGPALDSPMPNGVVLQSIDDQDVVPLPKKAKKTAKVISDVAEHSSVSEKPKKKKPKDKDEDPKKPQAKPKPKEKEKEKEKEQFKSREFILDSDDELTLGNGESMSSGVTEPPLKSSVAQAVASSVAGLHEPSPMVSTFPGHDSSVTPSSNSALPDTSNEGSKKKTASKKRKTRVETDAGSQRSPLDILTAEGQGFSVNLGLNPESANSSKDGPKTKTVSKKRKAAEAPDVDMLSPKSLTDAPTVAEQESPIKRGYLTKFPKEGPKKKTVSNKRKAEIETASDAIPVDTTDRPSPKKAKRSERIDLPSTKETPKRATALSTTDANVIPSSSEQRLEVSVDDDDAPKAKKKKAGRLIIEDEEEDGDAKENINATSKQPITTITPARVMHTPNRKPIYPHPPKNRSLSAILQRVNSSSPRPRASPAVSRNLLARIAPLHPNRRTPPPPPPPRIIPKKTRKELEREEKWEEELQETVEGWCELEEGERERMRRAKRDWELGLCEE
ncbi:hypothetical protein K439DRAFT_957466 [Ramaria rubella]|nr:hypothetical protein K439DRAFT_957466 [Ramaria rubella]